MLSSSIDDKGDIDKVINRFIKKLNGCIATNFDKRRINKDKDNKEDDLYSRMRLLKNKNDDKSITELNEVIKAIAETADTNFQNIKDELNKMKLDERKLDSRQLWKLKNFFSPKFQDPRSAMEDAHGNLLTSHKATQKRALEVYEERLKGKKWSLT